MKVLIVDSKTNEIVASQPVQVSGLNYEPREQEYFDLAWKAAVDDGTVQAKDRGKYEFRLERK
jgi:hypothetical protein